MDSFARKSEADKQAYFELAADRKGLSKQIIEKDFWVCWTLKHLFSLPEVNEYLIFKGGTSLSKAYNLIERFSEDIDISVDKQFFGFVGVKDPMNASSSKKQQAIIKDLSYACRAFVQEELKSLLIEKFSDILDSAQATWNIEPDPLDKDGQTLLFNYPTQRNQVLNDYINPSVKIELGARGGSHPTNTCSITPFIEEAIPGTLTERSTSIRTLAAERTFWEKATIAHMFSRWPEIKPIPERQSRHFFDLYRLLQSEVKETATNTPALLEEVAKHKKIYFRAAWAQYDKAIQGSLCLIPSDNVLSKLENDYQKMQEMFYGELVPWDTIISNLSMFEYSFNRL